MPNTSAEAFRVLICLALALSLAACSGESAGTSEENASESGETGMTPVDTLTKSTVKPAPEAFRTEALAVERVLGDSAQFGDITTITPHGDVLLVSDKHRSPHIAILDQASGRVLTRFGRQGEGPTEFISPRAAHVVPDSVGTVEIFDFQNRRLSRIAISPPSQARVTGTLPFRIDVSVTHPVVYGDHYISNGVFADHSLVVLDTTGVARRYLVTAPPFSPDELAHPTGRRLINRTFLASAERGRKLVLAYQFASMLDFVNLEDGTFTRVEGPYETEPQFHVERERFFWEDQNEMAYWSVQATSSRVYALFCGCPMSDNAPPTQLQVYDWQGELIGVLKFDHKISTFAVSPDDTTIWAYFETPVPRIGEWKVPKWVRESAVDG